LRQNIKVKKFFLYKIEIKKNIFTNKSAFSRSEPNKLKQILFTSTKSIRNKKKNFEKEIKIDESKDMYFELLVSAAEGILEKGLVSLDEIYVATECFEDLRACDNQSCNSRGPKKDQMWNRAKDLKSNKYLFLCNDCFKAFKNGQYCYYCSMIYRDDLNDYLHTWIQCDYCEQWHHLHCEEIKGDYPNIAKLIQDPDFKYKCSPCRGKNQKKGKCKSKLLGQKRKCKGKAYFYLDKQKKEGVKEDLYGKGYSNLAMLSIISLFR
jgi:hypothetical protein